MTGSTCTSSDLMDHTDDDPRLMSLTIKDLDTGAEMTMDEFERKQLSLPTLQRHASGSDTSSRSQPAQPCNSPTRHDPQAAHAGSRQSLSGKSISKVAAWVKKKVKDPLKHMRGPQSPCCEIVPSPAVTIPSPKLLLDPESSSASMAPSATVNAHPTDSGISQLSDDAASSVSPSPCTTPRGWPANLTIPSSASPTSASAGPANPATPFAKLPAAVTPAARAGKTYFSSKLVREFADVRLAQEWKAHEGHIWAMAFSKDGKYLASGGQDGVVRVWEVQGHSADDLIPCSLDNPTTSSHPSGSPSTPCSTPTATTPAPPSPSPSASPASPASSGPLHPSGPSAASHPAFKPTPFRTFTGHTDDVLDLHWSHSRFLASASVDQSVRLWHLSLNECLRVFWHADFVTAVAFHPADPQLLASGSIDGRLRVWSVPDTAEVSSAETHEMVTAVAWDNAGRSLLAGTMKGRCRVYSFRAGRLDYATQLDVRHQSSASGAGGKKITGIVAMPPSRTARAGPAGPGAGSADRFLITSNDSRLRLYNAGRAYVQECKFKGHKNVSTQIRASVSAAGDRIICGSDDGWVYVWDTQARLESGGASARGAGGKNSAYEAFKVDDGPVLSALFAPSTCKDALLAHAGNGAVALADGKGSAILQPAGSGGHTKASAVVVVGGHSGIIRVFDALT